MPELIDGILALPTSKKINTVNKKNNAIASHIKEGKKYGRKPSVFRGERNTGRGQYFTKFAAVLVNRMLRTRIATQN